MVLTVLCDSYQKEKLENDDEREVLKIHPYLSPIKATILHLVKKIHSEKAMEIYNILAKEFNTSYDESGSIGKRYRRCDAVGTPFAITIDDDTLNNNTVTIRHRDTMKQETISVNNLVEFIKNNIKL